MSINHNIYNTKNPYCEEGLSDLAKVHKGQLTRFADYTPPEHWQYARDGFNQGMEFLGSTTSEELIKDQEVDTIDGNKVIRFSAKSLPEGSSDHKIVIYLHGGCGTLGDPAHMKQIPALLADNLKAQVISVDYPLAPYSNEAMANSKFTPAHDAAMAVYKAALREVNNDASRVVIAGDSAGGWLAFGTALMIRDQELPMPGAIVGYGPVFDFDGTTPAHTDESIIEQTKVLTPVCLNSVRDAIFGDDKDKISSEYASPIKASYEGFEDTKIVILNGGHDLLRIEGLELAEKLKVQGVKEVFYHCVPGMWHNYENHYDLPEAKNAAAMTSRFIEGDDPLV